jgi:hypothetical protein
MTNSVNKTTTIPSHVEILPPSREPVALEVRVVVKPSIVSDRRIDVRLPAGLSIADLLDRAIEDDTELATICASGVVMLVDPAERSAAVEVPAHRWASVKPKPGIVILAAAVPGKGGGGGKSIIGLVLSVAVMAAAAFAGAAIAAAPGIIEAIGTTGASVFGGVITAVTPLPGKLYIGRTIAL